MTELAGPRDRARARGPRDARGATRPGPGRQPEAGSCCLQGQSERPRLKEREQTPRAGAAAPRAVLPAVARAPRRLTPSRAGEYRNTLWGRERPQPRNCYRHGLLKLFQFMMRYCCSSLTAPTLHVQRHPRNIHVRENTVLVAFDAAHGSRNPLGVLKHVLPPGPPQIRRDYSLAQGPHSFPPHFKEELSWSLKNSWDTKKEGKWKVRGWRRVWMHRKHEEGGGRRGRRLRRLETSAPFLMEHLLGIFRI